MLFTFDVTAPVGSTKTSPASLEMKLKAGVVSKISVLIPDGHMALAHLAIKYGETQIMPWGDNQNLHGNDESVTWEEGFELPSEPASLTAQAWNDDEENPHTFYLRVWVTPKPEVLPIELITRVLKLIEKFLSRIIGVD